MEQAHDATGLMTRHKRHRRRHAKPDEELPPIEKNKDIYYLLPGMARGARDRYVRNVFVSIAVGLAVSALLYYFFRFISGI